MHVSCRSERCIMLLGGCDMRQRKNSEMIEAIIIRTRNFNRSAVSEYGHADAELSLLTFRAMASSRAATQGLRCLVNVVVRTHFICCQFRVRDVVY